MTVAGNQGQNVYPAPDNYPAGSFPQPVPAPTVDPDDAGTLITVRYSWEWQQVLLAAIDQLLNPATWLGDHDEVITALNRATNLKDLLQIDLAAAETVDTPYWDTEEDVDDEMSIEEQPWYGMVEDASVPPDELLFIEDAAIWVFTGLLAIATIAEVGPAPAIAFRTLAPKFVVAIRTGDYGRIIRLFVDGSEAARVTDDGSGDIVNIPVIADPSLETHQMYITSGAS